MLKLIVYILWNHNKLSIIYAIEKIRTVHNGACVKHNDRRILLQLGKFALRKLKRLLLFYLRFARSKATFSFRKLVQKLLASALFIFQASLNACSILAARLPCSKLSL